MCWAKCTGHQKSVKCNGDFKTNCACSNVKINLNMGLNQSATDRNCKCYNRIVQGMKRKIHYDCSYDKQHGTNISSLLKHIDDLKHFIQIYNQFVLCLIQTCVNDEITDVE